MKRLFLCGILLLFGCSAIIEKINFDLLAESYVIKPTSEARIQSCQQLKQESFDVFYSDQNQKCLKKYGKKLESQLKEMNEEDAHTDTLDFMNDFFQNQQKYNECKITQNFTIENGWMYLEYFEKLYEICENSDYFNKNEIKQVISEFNAIYALKKRFPDQQSLQRKQHDIQRKNIFNERLNKLVDGADSNPILKKLKYVAPDFMQAKLGENCPLIFLVDSLNEKGANLYSDWEDAENYKFIKTNAKTLIMSAGKIEMIFVKNGENKINVASLKNADKLLEGITGEYFPVISKNVVVNNWIALTLCD